MRFSVVVLALALLFTPGRAHAWADATVRSASARVTIDERAHAHVAIDATVRVDGGWLEALELDGLDTGLVLDPLDPVTMVRAPQPDAADLVGARAPEPLDPRVTLRDDGVVVLSFTRRHAPRRGDYVVHLAYDAELAASAHAESDGVHLVWTFPAWRHGLDSVQVEVLGPEGAAPVIEADDEIEVGEESLGGRTLYRLTRAHLARTREWPIALRVPEGVMVEALGALPPAPAPVHAAEAASPASPPRAPWQGGIALALASLYVALRVLRRSRVAEIEGVELRAWLPLPAPLAALFVLALGAAAMGVALTSGDERALVVLALAMLALGISRGSPRSASPRLGSFRHATRTIRHAARRAQLARQVGIDAWLDASTLPGVVVLAAFLGFVARAPREALGPALLAFAVAVVAGLDSPRAGRSLPPLVALAHLTAYTRRARVSLERPPLALMPVVHLDVRGVAQDARIRVLGALPDGTLRADLVVARSGLFGARVGLLVVAARGSALDQALAADGRFEAIAEGKERVARLTPVGRQGIDGAFARLLEAGETAWAREQASRAADRAAA